VEFLHFSFVLSLGSPCQRWSRFRWSAEARLSQTQLQKSLEQYQNFPKSVVVKHKIGVPMINGKKNQI